MNPLFLLSTFSSPNEIPPKPESPKRSVLLREQKINESEFEIFVFEKNKKNSAIRRGAELSVLLKGFKSKRFLAVRVAGSHF